MKKSIFIVLMISVFMLNLAYAACSDKAACRNQDNELFCEPIDTSCEYVIYIDDNSNCVIDSAYTDNDADGDLWSDNCDAFSGNSNEWLDIDGDGIGNNADCDDFDASNTADCSPLPPVTVASSTSPSSTSGSSSSGGSFSGGYCISTWDCGEWGECKDDSQERICVKTNTCSNNYNKPEEEQSCSEDSSEETVSTLGSGEDDEENKAETESEKTYAAETNEGLEGITGNAVNVPILGSNAAGLIVLILAILALVLFFVFKR
ncbi:MAG: hypothetical protein KAK00_05605 [Nanoarchaeota archaeon]|nr:hypothetical protein [Nanoarchaeota archaeon]